MVYSGVPQLCGKSKQGGSHGRKGTLGVCEKAFSGFDDIRQPLGRLYRWGANRKRRSRYLGGFVLRRDPGCGLHGGHELSEKPGRQGNLVPALNAGTARKEGVMNWAETLVRYHRRNTQGLLIMSTAFVILAVIIWVPPVIREESRLFLGICVVMAFVCGLGSILAYVRAAVVAIQNNVPFDSPIP